MGQVTIYIYIYIDAETRKKMTAAAKSKCFFKSLWIAGIINDKFATE